MSCTRRVFDIFIHARYAPHGSYFEFCNNTNCRKILAESRFVGENAWNCLIGEKNNDVTDSGQATIHHVRLLPTSFVRGEP